MFSGKLLQPEPAEHENKARIRILIVEDEETQILALATRLQSLGYETLLARDGAEGARVAESECPDLVLLDLGLPDVDGLEVCQQLSDSPRVGEVPVVILSGRDDPRLVRRCRSAGCRYFLHKPYDPNVLLTLIESCLNDELPDRW